MQKHTETTHRSAAWFNSANSNGQLEIHPPYQRNPVWSVRQKSSLIETMLYEYPVPELYMQDIVDERGNQKHIIVDGQQRISAVLDFIHGSFELSLENSRWDGVSFDDLSSSDRRKIFEYKFVIRILPDMVEDEVRAIFQRINRNTVVLNAQELRHATYWGSFIKLMEAISDLEYWSRFEIFSANDRRRMIDTEFVSEIAVSVLNGIQNKKTKLEDYYRIYEGEFDEEQQLKSTFLKVLGEIDQLLTISASRFKKKSDFYTLFLVVAERRKSLPFSHDQRVRLGKILVFFSNRIDLMLRHGYTLENNDFMSIYAKNVERAASDLGARRARHKVLGEIFDRTLMSTGDVIVLGDVAASQSKLSFQNDADD